MTTEKKANVCAIKPIFSEVLRVLSNIKVCEWASQTHTLQLVSELETRITKIIKNIPKIWFRDTFASLPKRWRKCVSLRTHLTDFYIRKNS